VLCYARTRLVDACGEEIAVYDKDFALEQARPAARLAVLRQQLGLNNAMNGVIRTAMLRQTRLVKPYAGSDVPMLVELALRGRFALLPDALFSRRIAEDSNAVQGSAAEFAMFLDPNAGDDVRRFESLRVHSDHVRAILHAPVPMRDVFASLANELRYMRWDHCNIGRGYVPAILTRAKESIADRGPAPECAHA
jgi:hypothetical protein